MELHKAIIPLGSIININEYNFSWKFNILLYLFPTSENIFFLIKCIIKLSKKTVVEGCGYYNVFDHTRASEHSSANCSTSYAKSLSFVRDKNNTAY